MEPRVTFSPVGAIIVWVTGPAVLVAQIIIWFRTGQWPPWTFGDGCTFIGLAHPVMNWLEGQQICDWVWSWPLWLGLFVSTATLAALIPHSRRS